MILCKLLNLCELTIDDIYFTECCKCIIDDRKNLRKSINNCREILFEQLKNMDIEIVRQIKR